MRNRDNDRVSSSNSINIRQRRPSPESMSPFVVLRGDEVGRRSASSLPGGEEGETHALISADYVLRSMNSLEETIQMAMGRLPEAPMNDGDSRRLNAEEDGDGDGDGEPEVIDLVTDSDDEGDTADELMVHFDDIFLGYPDADDVVNPTPEREGEGPGISTERHCAASVEVDTFIIKSVYSCVPFSDIVTVLSPEDKETLTCPICLDCMSHPLRETVNNHSFGKACLSVYRQSTGNNSCPLCRTRVSNDMLVTSSEIEAKLSSVFVKCQHCFCEMSISAYHSHIVECPARKELIDRELRAVIGEMKAVFMIEIDQHLREAHSRIYETYCVSLWEENLLTSEKHWKWWWWSSNPWWIEEVPGGVCMECMRVWQNNASKLDNVLEGTRKGLLDLRKEMRDSVV